MARWTCVIAHLIQGYIVPIKKCWVFHKWKMMSPFQNDEFYDLQSANVTSLLRSDGMSSQCHQYVPINCNTFLNSVFMKASVILGNWNLYEWLPIWWCVCGELQFLLHNEESLSIMWFEVKKSSLKWIYPCALLLFELYDAMCVCCV